MKLHFKKDNGSIDKAIGDILDMIGKVHHPDLVREMILAALKAGQEGGKRADMLLMNTTLKEMRFTSKVFSPYEEVRKVSVFGSARTRPEEGTYKTARALGQGLAKAGYMVITGGGPGIMQAVNEGAGPEHSFGINIRLPFEQKSNPVVHGNKRNITYKYFFNRKVAFLKQAHAVVLFPGGFGTLDEAMETFTLVQTGKGQPIPLILVDNSERTYWSRWLGFLERELLDHGYIGENDLSLFHLAQSVDDVISVIQHFYSRYHSLRYVGDKLAIRVHTPIHEESMSILKSRFSDILVDGGDIVLSEPLEEEKDEQELAHLPRIIVDFNRKDFARLRNLIDAINDC